MDKNKIADFLVGVIFAIACVLVALIGFASLTGCASSYKGAKVVDGFNVEMGMTIPGTQLTINFLSYTGGLKVGVNDGCRLSVYNEVIELNSYLFGALTTSRNSKTRSNVYPTVQDSEPDGRDGPPGDDQP